MSLNEPVCRKPSLFLPTLCFPDSIHIYIHHKKLQNLLLLMFISLNLTNLPDQLSTIHNKARQRIQFFSYLILELYIIDLTYTSLMIFHWFPIISHILFNSVFFYEVTKLLFNPATRMVTVTSPDKWSCNF